MKVFDITNKSASVNVAKDRLKILLVSDRMNCSPDTIEKMENDIFIAISKYIEITPEEFKMKVTQSDIHIKITGD
ncbi:cell division topological specificity factor MinE [Lachnospiraceae bacterium LCP25S3_G4]